MRYEDQLAIDGIRQKHAERLSVCDKIYRHGVVTPYDLAYMMDSSVRTITKCFNAGKLHGSRIPCKNGSKRTPRKIPLDEAFAFMCENNCEVTPWIVRTALVTSSMEPGLRDNVLIVPPTTFDLGFQLTRYAIRRVIIDTSIPSKDAAPLKESIRNFYPAHMTPQMKVVMRKVNAEHPQATAAGMSNAHVA